MSNIENDLRAALEREQPSADFAERVLEALPARPATVVLMPPRPHRARLWLAAAAMLAIGAGTLWFAAFRPGSETDIVGGVTNVGIPGPRQPIFEGGSDRPTVKPEDPPRVVPEDQQHRSLRSPRVRRVNRPLPSQADAASREQDAQAFLAARQLRLALTITNEKLRVAQRGVADRSDLPTG